MYAAAKYARTFTEGEVCSVCSPPSATKASYALSPEPRDVLSIERSHEYNGVYHVLHGVLSPISHVGPDDIRISERYIASLPITARSKR